MRDHMFGCRQSIPDVEEYAELDVASDWHRARLKALSALYANRIALGTPDRNLGRIPPPPLEVAFEQGDHQPDGSVRPAAAQYDIWLLPDPPAACVTIC